MAQAITTPVFARTVVINDETIGLTSEDLRNARIFVQKDGQKGPLKKEDIIEWYTKGAEEFALPEPSEKKRAAKVDDSNEVTAVLNYRVINNKGQLNKTVHSLDITKGEVRKIRLGLRGKYSAENLLQAALPKIEDTFSPYEIVDANSNVYEITKDENNSWSAARSKSGTETCEKDWLMQRLKSLNMRQRSRNVIASK